MRRICIKCIQVSKIKIWHYLEDRLTVNDRVRKPRDSHIQLQSIPFTGLFSQGHSNLVKICFVTPCRDLITPETAITSTPEFLNVYLLNLIIKVVLIDC